MDWLSELFVINKNRYQIFDYRMRCMHALLIDLLFFFDLFFFFDILINEALNVRF